MLCASAGSAAGLAATPPAAGGARAGQGGDIRKSRVAVVQARPPPTTMLRPFSVIKAGYLICRIALLPCSIQRSLHSELHGTHDT